VVKAVLHIGTPKTATTYLQNTLVANAKLLAKYKICYPNLLRRGHDHISLFCAVSPHLHPFQSEYGITKAEQVAPFQDKLRAQLQAEIKASPKSVFVMSSENLSGNLLGADAIGNLHAFLSPLFEEIEVVVYLRRQDDAQLSMYAEFMRKGFTEWSFNEFIAKAQEDPNLVRYLYYKSLLRDWVEVFGRNQVKPRVFEATYFAGGSLLSDFLSLISDRPEKLGARLKVAPRENESLSAPALEFLRMIRPAVPFGIGGQANPERAALMPRINRLPIEPKPIMSHAQSQRIMAHYATANSFVAQEFFPDGPPTLFPDDVRSVEQTNLGQISLAQFRTYYQHVLGKPLPGLD